MNGLSIALLVAACVLLGAGILVATLAPSRDEMDEEAQVRVPERPSTLRV